LFSVVLSAVKPSNIWPMGEFHSVDIYCFCLCKGAVLICVMPESDTAPNLFSRCSHLP